MIETRPETETPQADADASDTLRRERDRAWRGYPDVVSLVCGKSTGRTVFVPGLACSKEGKYNVNVIISKG